MRSEKIKLSDEREIEVKELKYKDITEFQSEDKNLVAKKILILCTGMSNEDYENLTMKDGIAIQKVINNINGFDDFQNPQRK